MKEIINEIITRHREKQGTSRRLLKIERLEKDLIAELGSLSRYEEVGGYKQLYKEVMILKEKRILKKLTKPVPHWKKPQLDEAYWLMPIYVTNEWNMADIAKVLSYLNINFYIRNKKFQTSNEWAKIKILFDFLISKEQHPVVSREERSLMLFKNLFLPEDTEPEKFLGSKHGQQLLNRLHLNPQDLRYRVVREPFHYWENIYCPEQHSKEVLVIEGLSTYETLKMILSQQLPWNFGPIPRYLIWGEGYRTSNTLGYLHDVDEKPEQLTIRYTGDIDYEGFNIYVELKKKYEELNLTLAQSFYQFLVTFIDEFAVDIRSKQRIVDEHLYVLTQEFVDDDETYQGIRRLWKEGKRIPQECINLETILKKAGSTNGKGFTTSI